jgi:hypothetical protein
MAEDRVGELFYRLEECKTQREAEKEIRLFGYATMRLALERARALLLEKAFPVETHRYSEWTVESDDVVKVEEINDVINSLVEVAEKGEKAAAQDTPVTQAKENDILKRLERAEDERDEYKARLAQHEGPL